MKAEVVCEHEAAWTNKRVFTGRSVGSWYCSCSTLGDWIVLDTAVKETLCRSTVS